MALSDELISQFAKAMKEEKTEEKESIVYGTTVLYNGTIYVKLDGSDRLTPISKTADVTADERVTVMIKDHTATITGNISSPAARTDDVKDLGTKVTDFEIVVAKKVDTEVLNAQVARIDTLTSENVTIKNQLTAANASIESLEAETVEVTGKLTAVEAEIESIDSKIIEVENLFAEYATIENLEVTNANIHNLESDYGAFKVLSTEKFTASEAEINSLKTDKLDANTANLTYATIKNLEATNAEIESLESKYASFDYLKAIEADIKTLQTEKLSATEADLKYANIDFSNIDKATMEWFYANSGLIKDVEIGDATITGHLVGVTISGDLIEGNTIKADKLVIKNDKDGLYYKLNIDAGAIATEQVSEEDLQNGLSGKVIIANSITAEKINVDDLVAFDATIGGFNITDNSLYSGVKASVDNTTEGVYLDSDGQAAIGDGSRYLKFYKDGDVYKLAIQADTIILGSDNKNLDADFYTKTQTDSQIKVESEAITSTVSETYATNNDVEFKVNEAKTLIRQLSDQISSLITDGNGASLMTQTEDGWTFSIADIQNSLNSASSNIDQLTGDVSTLDGLIEALNGSLSELDGIKNSVRIITEGNSPCIELSSSGSTFKVQITNTEFRIMEGNIKHVWINNDAMNIRKVRVENEFEIGGFIWKRRSNGNVGLMWSTYSSNTKVLTIIVQSVGTSNQTDISILINGTLAQSFSGGHDDTNLVYSNVESASVRLDDNLYGTVQIGVNSNVVYTTVFNSDSANGSIYELPTEGTIYIKHTYMD